MPQITKRAPTIDFIDQRLPKYHPAFATSSVQYDPMALQYVPAGQVIGSGATTSLVPSLAANQTVGSYGVPQRPNWTDTNAMQFWNTILPESMTRLQSTPEPNARSSTPYSIRNKYDWDEIYNALSIARAKYGETGGRMGWVRKVRRKAADNITPGADAAKIASKVIPQDKVATPVIGAVEILFDAIKVAATVRNQLLTGFDGLVPIFSDVELFLGTFPGDKNIRNASVDLICTTLEAIEKAITFFTSNELLRGGKALLGGEDYQKDLRESIEAIQTKARDLMQQALKSHIFESHIYSEETRRLLQQTDRKVDIVLAGTNSIEYLLRDHVIEKDRALAEKDRLLQAAREENKHLRVENVILRATSPVQQGIWAPPPQPMQTQALDWYISQDMLRSMIATYDIDVADLAYVSERKEQLQAKDRSRAEQIIHTQLFRDWIVSASSAKLLVHWDFHLPKKIAEVSPLSVFCMTMAQSLRNKDRFLSAVWFCGNHIDPSETNARIGGHAMISSLIDQLLRQTQFDTRFLHESVGLESIRKGSLEALVQILCFLVRQLPSAVTVFFIIDGVFLYEREEYEQNATAVFVALIQITADPSIMASVKLLFTSTPGTDVVRGAFEQDDLILNVDSLPRLATANDERMVRELEGSFVGED